MMLPLLRNVFASRFVKELILAFVIGLIADIAVDAVREWAENQPKEHVTEKPVERDDIARNVVPPPDPPPVIEEIEEEPPQIAKDEGPPPPQALDGSTVYTHYCDTPQGERATFQIVVFSEAYNWQIRSSKDLEINGEKKSEEEFLEILSAEGYKQIMGTAQELVVAGTASCEGDDWWEEEKRALRRALKLREWVERSRAWTSRPRPPRSIHTLNLGQYQDDCGSPQACYNARSEETWSQRKIILMAILERNADLDKEDIAWCIKESVRKDDQLDFLMRHYCRYDLNTDLNGNST